VVFELVGRALAEAWWILVVLYQWTAWPGPAAAPVMFDQVGLVEADGRLDEGVVQGVADGADRWGDPRVEQRLGETQCRILRPGIGMEHDSLGDETGVGPPAGEQGLFQGRHDQRCRLR
jgi:hypothetical protein